MPSPGNSKKIKKTAKSVFEKHKHKIVFSASAVIVIVIVAAIGFFVGVGYQRVFIPAECNSPLEIIGNECCLDEDNTGVCDTHEVEEEPEVIAPYCGDGSCFAETENCENCVKDCGTCSLEKMTKFNVINVFCSATLSRLFFSIKNIHDDTLFINEIWINAPKGNADNIIEKIWRNYISSDGELADSYKIDCANSDYFEMRLKGLDENNKPFDEFGQYKIEVVG
ncbi:MAG: hypothetical protein ABIF08_02090 [Nanoarchaeota archaeon]